jgi:hypothetical protein
MRGTWVGIALIAVLLIWLLGVGKRKPVAPEDDVDTPIDEEELAEAEAELKDDPDARPTGDDDEDDWGPGTGGHSPVPGVLP